MTHFPQKGQETEQPPQAAGTPGRADAARPPPPQNGFEGRNAAPQAPRRSQRPPGAAAPCSCCQPGVTAGSLPRAGRAPTAMPPRRQPPGLPRAQATGCWTPTAAPRQSPPPLTHKTPSTTRRSQRHRSCTGVRAPSLMGTWLGGRWPRRGLEPPPRCCGSEDSGVTALLQTHALDACDDSGNRNGLNVCSRVASVFVSQAQRDFSSAPA